jgi:hypothetical protein
MRLAADGREQKERGESRGKIYHVQIARVCLMGEKNFVIHWVDD